MSAIILGENAKLDIDRLLSTRLLVQANSGKGKSHLLRRIAELFFGKVQVIIIDPEGEFATLREEYGYVLVGKGGETPADPRSAALVAHKLLELKASAVCDLYEMKPAMRHEWVAKFIDAMIDAPKNLWHPCVVIVDEAHVFCPEKGAGESQASEAMIGLATRGRKRGFACIFATQRLGKLRKDAAAELLNVMIGGTFIDVDRKRAADALGVYGAEQHKFFDEIKLLPRGHFFALGPAISDERILVRVGPVKTTHPEAGSAKRGAGPPPAPEAVANPIDLERLDAGIRPVVECLLANGVETFESCEGGEGHAFHEPTVRFHGNHAEGFRVLAIALQHGLRVCELRRYYSIEDGVPVGPHWEMTFLDGTTSPRGLARTAGIIIYPSPGEVRVADWVSLNRSTA